MSITVGYICWYSKKYESHQKKNKCVVQAAQRDWNDMNVLLQSASVHTRDFWWIKSTGFRHWETAEGLWTVSVHYQNGVMDGVCSVGTYTTHLSSLGFSKKRDYNYKKQHSFIKPHS